MRPGREGIAEHRAELFRAHGDSFGIALYALLMYELEKVKEQAVTPGSGDVAVLQGQAVAYKTILKYLTEQPALTKPV